MNLENFINNYKIVKIRHSNLRNITFGNGIL